MIFTALDFETADPMRDSACAVALVRVEGAAVVAREVRLLRPPRREFYFTHIHGITWSRVAAAPPFEEAWPDLLPLLDGAEFLAAHNAPFDRSVLAACCDRGGMRVPELPYLCTVRLARRAWDIHPTRLPDVCGRVGIPLRHHEAGSDAEACARIVLAAAAEGGERLVRSCVEGGAPLRRGGPTASPRRGRPWPPRSAGSRARA